ncbi:uncharacterized protein FIBRA_05276 [Fibroporia radiculosa]|uniref:CID domain-containing protein n=1 Tax=Fibroporia radiculosa TaxID=599839 RepID=J4H3E9_9APHY|nr:uncharacterized protein FIBRA_05276 [Fibroporia radiculosa]CCM03154.1 predicted protein [Fibroporia radiculosa]
MSLYPQPHTQVFNSPPYPAQGYGQPLIPPTSYHYPPPVQPTFHVDPQTFRRDYTTRLADLTVNSRPIIQNLSMIAQEYSRYAEIVAQCIEMHIRRVPLWMKLPAFYLLDAMSKNVFDPYARCFTPLVVTLFIDTYEQVDPSTRSKMEEMLLTWRTGAPNGRELFGVVPQVAIERHIWGGDTTMTASSSRSGGSSSISTAQVLSELEFVLSQKERTLQANPYDKLAQNHVAVLQQLRKLVQAGVSQEELNQILTQLRSLAQPASSSPPPVPAPVPQSYSTASYSVSPPSYPTPIDQTMYPSQPAYPTASFSVSKTEPVDFSLLVPQPTAASSVSATVSAPSAPASNIANLFNALVRTGVLSTSGTPTGAGTIAKTEEAAAPAPPDPEKEVAKVYRKTILANKLKLTSADIVRQRLNVASLLYKRLPVQCKQCGVRFPDGPKGRKTMEGHLDMHFRQNRKASQAVSRGYSRSWFISVEDWVHDGSIDIKGKGRADGRKINSSAAAAAEAAKREAELRALFVVVPPGDEAKPISCPICKEILKSEFLEDDEEWVWRNAVRRDDKIYHATCHAEATASKSTLAVRLRNEVSSSRSRSQTPEKQILRTPPKVSLSFSGEQRKANSPSPTTPMGMKRKADDDASNSSLETMRGEPPTKKLAVSA